MSRRPAGESIRLREEFNEAERNLASRNNPSGSLYGHIEKADKMLRFAWWIGSGFGVGLVGITAFYITVSSTLAKHDEVFSERAGRLKALEAYIANDLLSKQAQDTINKKFADDIARLTQMEKPLWHMEELRKAGRTNKEDFFLERGFSAPNGKE